MSLTKIELPMFSFGVFQYACLLMAAVSALTPLVVAQEEDYPVPPEAERQEGVPEGKVEGPFEFSNSRIFPGTTRQYWIYVPAQYAADKPACTLIVQDGLARAEEWRLPLICDNLIHSREMPVTIGIFVSPGVVAADKASAQPRFNRSFEYDSLGDRYARFLLEELLPMVSQDYNLSTEPGDRAIPGASSGGICAFNVAWERPDAFHRVLSTIGTYVGLRGGNDFPMLIRKTEPKPLRVFLQDGSQDLNIYAGDWWVANQDMYSALAWAGYDVKRVWGKGGHSGAHAAAIMPQALRWLWRDYPQPIQAAEGNANRRVDVLVGGKAWELVSSGHGLAEAPAGSPTGELYFCDSKAGRIYVVGEDKKIRIFADQVGDISSLAFGADGNLFGIRDGKEIVRFDSNGNESQVLEGITAEALEVLPDAIYFLDPVTPAVHRCNLAGGEHSRYPVRISGSGLAPTADHAFLHVVGPDSRFTTNCRIRADGSLDHRQQFGFLHIPYGMGRSLAEDIVVDRLGRAYVASGLGIQVLDQLGRVNFIISPPSRETLNGLAFGGTARRTLYVTAGDSVYRRDLKTPGRASFEEPLLPPKPQM